MTRVFLFQPCFVPKILDGTKHQTIRRQARCKPGDTISLRYWDGVPRRRGSRQIVILETVCTAVRRVMMRCASTIDRISIDDRDLSRAEESDFAIADGFDSLEAMIDWFYTSYGPVFTGEMIEWEPPQ